VACKQGKGVLSMGGIVFLLHASPADVRLAKDLL